MRSCAEDYNYPAHVDYTQLPYFWCYVSRFRGIIAIQKIELTSIAFRQTR
jgi:hypothetical protein